MGTLNTLFDFIAFGGDLPEAGSQKAFRATFQPSLPYLLSDTTNLFVRPAIPVIFSQNVPTPDGFESKGPFRSPSASPKRRSSGAGPGNSMCSIGTTLCRRTRSVKIIRSESAFPRLLRCRGDRGNI